MPSRKCGPKKISLTARSPDMTPIENVFNYVRTKLHEGSLNRNITFENVEEFLLLIKKLCYQYQLNINKTTESIDTRLSMVVKKR